MTYLATLLSRSDISGDSYTQTETGTMTEARYFLAESVVQHEDYSEWCE